MLLDDDVVAYGEAEPCAFSGRLGREERVENLIPKLSRDSHSIIADTNFHLIAMHPCCRAHHRLKIDITVCDLPFGDRVKSIGDQIEQYPGNLLRKHLDHARMGIEVSSQRDIELGGIAARAMLGETKGFIHESIDVSRATLPATLPGMQQHVLHNGIRTPAVLDHLAKVSFS